MFFDSQIGASGWLEGYEPTMTFSAKNRQKLPTPGWPDGMVCNAMSLYLKYAPIFKIYI